MKITYNNVQIEKNDKLLPKVLQKAKEVIMAEDQKILFKPQPIKV